MDRAADGTEVLRDSTLEPRFRARAAGALRLELARLREGAAFAFKRMDLRPGDGRFAAFFVALDFDLAFVAISVRNCKWIAQKSQGMRRASTREG